MIIVFAFCYFVAGIFYTFISCLIDCLLFIATQNIQLSYANAELGQILIRSTHATPNHSNDQSILITSTVHPTITTSTRKPESSGYLNGSILRSIFSRNGGTTTTSTTTQSPQNPRRYTSSSNVLMGPSGSSNSYRNVLAQQQQQPISTTQRYSTSTISSISYRNALIQNQPRVSSTTNRYETTVNQQKPKKLFFFFRRNR